MAFRARVFNMQSALSTRATSAFFVRIASMVIDFLLSVDLVAVRGFITLCLCLD